MWGLYINNNGSWVNILNKGNNLSWNSEGNTSVELSFSSIYNLKEGKLIYLYKNQKEIFRGVIVKKNEGNASYTYSALDYVWYLNKNEEIKQFNSISATKAITQLLNAVDIKSNIINMNTIVNKVYKDQTITSIIEDILEQVTNETGIQYCKYMDVNVFTVAKVQDLKIYPNFIIGNDLTVNSSIEDLKNSIVVASNEGENANIIASAKDNDSIAKIGRLQEVITVEEKDYSQANNIAKNLLKDSNRVKKEMSINIIAIENGEEIKSNRLIYLDIKERNIKDWFRIKSASHSLENDLHKVSLTFEYFEVI